jgi:hypothetical protein
LKTFLWSWLLFWTTGRKKMATLFEDFLYKNRFPQPPEYVGGIGDYFSQVANDSKMHPALRVKAAIELGTMAGIKTAGRYSMGMQLHLAYEDALETSKSIRDVFLHAMNDSDCAESNGDCPRPSHQTAELPIFTTAPRIELGRLPSGHDSRQQCAHQSSC